MEPIRGEGGIRMLPEGYLQEAREICNRRGILMILDEVQSSFGRTGKNFACQNWDVTPDIMCLAKPFAGGLPIGITVAREDLMSAFKTGEHTTTFSGSPHGLRSWMRRHRRISRRETRRQSSIQRQILQNST